MQVELNYLIKPEALCVQYSIRISNPSYSVLNGPLRLRPVFTGSIWVLIAAIVRCARESCSCALFSANDVRLRGSESYLGEAEMCMSKSVCASYLGCVSCFWRGRGCVSCWSSRRTHNGDRSEVDLDELHTCDIYMTSPRKKRERDIGV